MVRVLLLVSLAVALVACSESPKLAGTAFDPPQPAPDFTLTDQRGQSVQLSSYRGDAVALTFIYTNCTDVCPLIAEKLRRAYDALPPATQQKVQLLAVTVDPARDDRRARVICGSVRQGCTRGTPPGCCASRWSAARGCW